MTAAQLEHTNEPLVARASLATRQVEHAVSHGKLWIGPDLIARVLANQERRRLERRQQASHLEEHPPHLGNRRRQVMDRLERVDDDDFRPMRENGLFEAWDNRRDPALGDLCAYRVVDDGAGQLRFVEELKSLQVSNDFFQW